MNLRKMQILTMNLPCNLKKIPVFKKIHRYKRLVGIRSIGD